MRTLSANAGAASHSQAEELFAALGARVTDPLREPKYDSARIKIARAALLPSRVWNDTAVWTSSTAARRTLTIAGHFAGDRYRLEATRAAKAPTSRAESRHLINLTRLTSNEFAWDTDVAYAVGMVPARNVGAFVTALLVSADGRSEADVRADYRRTIPRASTALGRLFRPDSITTVIDSSRSTLATYAASMTPEGIADRYPNFAQYARKYLASMAVTWRLTDRAGIAFLDGAFEDGRIRLRVRTRDHALVSLESGAGPLPDSLVLVVNLTMNVRHFTVGFREYHGEFVITRGEHERSWSVTSRREPDWVLPLFAERLLRSPLRRPFQGSGALFRIGVRDSVGSHTLLQRRLHLEVEESTVLRFIGRLGAIAVSDYTGLAEREQYAWLEEVFGALIADAAAYVP